MTEVDKGSGLIENIEDFLSFLAGALTNCLLYSYHHPQTQALARRSFQVLDQILNSRAKISLVVVENNLLVEDYLIPSHRSFTLSLIKKLIRNKIESVTFIRGIEYQEFADFIRNLAFPLEEEKSKSIISSPHLKLGKIGLSPSSEVAQKGESQKGLEQGKEEKLFGLPLRAERYIDSIKEIFQKVKKKEKLEINALNEIISHFILAIKRQSNPLLILAPLKRYDLYTYTHAINVCILTCYQAASLGFAPEDIREIGLAAMLHDIGKLFIPLKILNKKDILTDEEWEIIQTHPIEGAKLLLETEGIIPLTIEVAYEHHMKFNLSGYPKAKFRKEINIISQLTSISDFYDALMAKRPYRKSLKQEEVVQFLCWRSGTDFDPKLINNFLKTISGET